MREVILYIATSLDGYIADENGSVDWLEAFPNPDQVDYGYNEFYQEIDTILMGRKSYEQIMGFDVEFPFSDKKNYVFTRSTDKQGDKHAKYISADAADFVSSLKKKAGKEIWLLGGAGLNTTLLEHKLIDRMIITQTPILLGKGIPLFHEFSDHVHLKLLSTENYPTTGFIQTQHQILG